MNDEKSLQQSRRTFLKTTALASTGMLLPSLNYSMVNVFNEKKLKLALVGCGGRGSGAANQALQADDHIELVAMADLFEDRLNESFNNLSNAYAETEKMNVQENAKFVGFDAYKKAIDMADIVILATPPGFRPYHFEYAVSTGKHVFMEKPLATDTPGIRKVLEMAKVADEKNLKVVVGLQRRYQENYLDIYQQLQNGVAGKITGGQVYWNGGGVWVRSRKPEYSELEYQMRNWYYFNWICGDNILEQHIHNIDVANWYIGEYPDSAQGMGGRQVRKGPEVGEIFDHHFVEYTYPGGAIISSQCRHQPNTMYKVAERFQTTEGFIDTNDGGVARLYDLDKHTIAESRNSEGHNPYQEEHNQLFKAIRENQPLNNAEYGAMSTLTAIMGRMATYSGKVITREEALNSELQLMPAELDWDYKPVPQPREDGTYACPIPGETKVL